MLKGVVYIHRAILIDFTYFTIKISAKMRPNIRVEIQNNLVEAMEVDENEEGEISDSEDKGTPEKPLQFTNPTENKTLESSFQTGINILDKGKLEERARRFQLNPSEIKNFTDEDLKVLHSSLGINQSNESNTRSEVIHIRGIDQMNAGDILDYFLEYAPVSVEWIDEESCNVVWSDKISAARALHFMSKAVRGMPVRDDTSYFDNLQETEEIDQSVLVMNKNREIQLQEDGETTTNKLLNEKNSVDISEITTTIPPGYWRLGKKHPNAKCLLMRFSLKTDKKHFKTEQFSRYYKAQGKKNWNVGIPPNAKQTTQGIFGRNKDMHRGGNPWSILAKNWDEDAKFREKERTLIDEEPKIEIKNPTLRTRLGSKRKEDEMDTEENVKPKKMKIPRMRMYADEEEEKIKRRKMLKRINHQMKKIDDEKTSSSDLRTVLNLTSRTHAVKIEQPEPEVFDLGSTLKNRNRKMVFEIKTEQERSHRHKENSKSSEERRFSKEKRSRRYSNSDDEYSNFRHDKPQSKVAVVIKTQKRPTVASAVASTVWSRVQRPNYSESDSPSSESESSSGSASESEDGEESREEEETVSKRPTSRPGFTSQIKERPDFKSPLKIEISNDHFKRS